MNRQERRKMGVAKKEPVINIKVSDIEKIKREAVEEACKNAFILMLAIPAVVMRDKYAQLMKREGRLERFADLCIELYDTYDKGYVSLEELHSILWDECGVEIEGANEIKKKAGTHYV